MLVLWTLGCEHGPDCTLGANGHCVPKRVEDVDQDGATVEQGDCDDSDPALNLHDADQDGYSTCLHDCDDDDPSRGPPVAAFAEECDGVDSDCSGVVDEDDTGKNVCVLDVRVPRNRWTSLDLLYVADSDFDFAIPAIDFEVHLDTLFRGLEGTDTRVGVIDGRVSAVAGFVELRGQPWLELGDMDPLDAAALVANAVPNVTNARNEPLSRARSVYETSTFFRDDPQALHAVLFHTNEDDPSTTGAEFLSAFPGRVIVFGPEPELACGTDAAPNLHSATSTHYYPNCLEPDITGNLDRVVEDLLPLGQIRYTYTIDVLPSTRAATVVRTDGTVVPLGPVDLDWNGVDTVTVRDYTWADIVEIVFSIQTEP